MELREPYCYGWSERRIALSGGEDGRERYEREGTVFSYENCTVAEWEGAIVGMLVAFPMPPHAQDGLTRLVFPRGSEVHFAHGNHLTATTFLWISAIRYGGNFMMGNGMMDGGMGIWMLLGTVFWILLIVGIVLLVVWVVQKAMGGGAGRTESVLEILKKRYARGEISKEEYEEKKRDLL
jgi:putative membrane protein